MVLVQKPEMLQNGFLELAKPKYSVQNEKWFARNENKAFWQWFWARSQKCFKTKKPCKTTGFLSMGLRKPRKTRSFLSTGLNKPCKTNGFLSKSV